MRVILSIFLLFFGFLTSKGQNGDAFFESSEVHDINITFYQSDWWDTLTANKAYDEATGINLYIPATISIDSVVLDSIGVRFRGNSSYGHPGQKKPFKLDFNEYHDTLKFEGLKKLNLSNGFLDPTMMREKLFFDFMNEQGLNAPRCTYAKVSVNGNYIGLYKAIEQIDKTFLKSRFDNKNGNLYKGEPDAPLIYEGMEQFRYYDNMELKTNDSINDWTKMVEFIDVVNNTPKAAFKIELEQRFAHEQYIKAWAANNLFGNLDSYMYLAHNYYMYENTDTDQMEWITWDVSLAFGVYALLIVPQSENFDILYLPNNKGDRPLNANILEQDTYKSLYLNTMCSYMSDGFNTQKLFPKIDSVANKIRPFLEAEPAANRMFTMEQFEKNIGTTQVNYQLFGQIPGLKSFVVERRSNVAKQMCGYKWSCSLGGFFDNNSDVVNVYPNPSSSGEITLDFVVPEEGGNVDYNLSDLSGRHIWSTSLTPDPATSSQQMHLLLPSGVYVLKTVGNCRQENKIIVIQH